ncbi:unnamed protein product [Heligmosomoides polygyrus]|uniref:snRNA-activating protein complex subunit 4 n=1 Tax=Heligmosomoides polygyrus TaxID=6339 RepID=A0A3P7X3L8_HELPZ|nr:unnamed protein product [Heligmosomoides polygyrus]
MAKVIFTEFAWLEKKLDHERGLDSFARSKVPVIQYLPPYFKDENMMCPPQNEEAKHKLQYSSFDPLIKEDKKWTPSELRLLKESVKNSVILASVQKFKDRKEILREKIQRAGVETSPEEIKQWKDEIEDLDRKVKHAKEGQVDSAQVDVVDYSTVDWLKISTPSFTSWAALAKKLQTQRTPYQCFERYRSDMYRMTRDWTKEEDDRLIALVKVMTVNGTVQWDKVTFYMPGRHRQQCRTRYQRTLDENVRHGRWSDHEDLLLMSAVARFGAKDWAKVAKAVVGRSDGQCRERWCNVLDKCTLSGDWTPEEDERLILGVQLFGRGQWSKFTDILPRHTPESMMDRYQALLSAKMRKKPGNAGLTDEERQLLDKGIDEISKKYRDNNSTPDMKEIFAKIKLNDKEISNIVCAAKQRRLCESVSRRESPRTFRRPLTKAPVRKIKKTSMLKVDSIYERTEFEPHETELLNNRCAHVASRLRECEYFPPDLTLAPTFSSAAAYRVFESSRVSLTRRASQYFNPSNCNTMGMLLYPEGDVVRTFKTHDRLHIQLHPNILTNENYLKLKASEWHTPNVLSPIQAIRRPVHFHLDLHCFQTQMELMELMMAQQDEIFIEAAVINKARHVEPRPRRGRMTNAERWVAQYRALQKEMDLPVTRKLQPDRSAKNKTSVEAGVEGISDEYVELDAADDMRPATSNSNQAVEVVHQGGSVHTVHDVDEAKLRLQREFVDQVVNEADRMSEIIGKSPKKRKRVKAKKPDLSESTIRVEKPASSVGLNQTDAPADSTSVIVDGVEASEVDAQVGPSRLGGESEATVVTGTGASSEALQASAISNSNQEVVSQPVKKRVSGATMPELAPQENPTPTASQTSSSSDLVASEAESAANPTVSDGDGAKKSAGATGAAAEGLGAEAVHVVGRVGFMNGNGIYPGYGFGYGFLFLDAREVVTEPVKKRGRPRKSEVAPKEKQVPPVDRSRSATASDGGSAHAIHQEASAISSPIGGSAISTVAQDGGSSKAEVVRAPAKRRGRPRKSDVAPKEKMVPSVAPSQSDSLLDAGSGLGMDEHAPMASSTATLSEADEAESPKRKRRRPVKWVSPSPGEQQVDEKPTLGKRGRMEE